MSASTDCCKIQHKTELNSQPWLKIRLLPQAASPSPLDQSCGMQEEKTQRRYERHVARLLIEKQNTTLGATGETASTDKRQMSRKNTLSTNNQCKFFTNPRQCQEKYDLYVSRGYEAYSGATWQEDGGSRMWGWGLGSLETRNEVVPQECFLNSFQSSPR